MHTLKQTHSNPGILHAVLAITFVMDRIYMLNLAAFSLCFSSRDDSGITSPSDSRCWDLASREIRDKFTWCRHGCTVVD